MARRGIAKAGTGLAVGALLTAPLLGVFTLASLAHIPSVPFTVFEWLIRVLPGRVVIFSLDLTLRVLQGLGFNIKNTAKTTEQVLAITSLFVAALVIGLLFFVLVRTGDRRRIRRYGLAVGGAVAAFSAAVTLADGVPGSVTGKIGFVVWTFALFLLWGWGMARLYIAAYPTPAARGGIVPVEEEAPAPPEEPAAVSEVARIRAEGQPAASEVQAGEPSAVEARLISRRRFIIQMGGLVATILVVGAGVGEVLRAQAVPKPQVVKAPIPFPNANSPVQPTLGTRPEYTAIADHYRVDIDLTAPRVDEAAWRLVLGGMVANPLSLTLSQIRSTFKSMDKFITISCISNPIGGALIGTTLWTGVSFRDVLAVARPLPNAKYAHITSEDGFDEEIDLALITSDPRIMLIYAWNGQPLPTEHGFPLRVYIPDRYGMKQPKWIKTISLASDSIKGYWVARGWDEKAEVNITSIIDPVITDSLNMRGGRTYVPIGGIAYAGAKGISKVEVQVDEGPWIPAELRAPLSELTWVIWRYEWPFAEGQHTFAVRTYDGQGRAQDPNGAPTFPSGASGIHRKTVEVLPVKL